MRRLFAGLLIAVTLSACAMGGQVVEFWRPISEPNSMMPLRQAQSKLDFDLNQCRCGIFPANVPQPDLIAFQPDQQRYAETSITRTAKDKDGECLQRPSLVVAECMRTRGWEVTNCSGRMPLAEGGALCAAYVADE